MRVAEPASIPTSELVASADAPAPVVTCHLGELADDDVMGDDFYIAFAIDADLDDSINSKSVRMHGSSWLGKSRRSRGKLAV